MARRYTPEPMPLTDRTIATIGSGVMAEAMIAGLLRGGQVTPDRIVASHPRADRREILERDYGIRVAASMAAGSLEIVIRDTVIGILGSTTMPGHPPSSGVNRGSRLPGRPEEFHLQPPTTAVS